MFLTEEECQSECSGIYVNKTRAHLPEEHGELDGQRDVKKTQSSGVAEVENVAQEITEKPSELPSENTAEDLPLLIADTSLVKEHDAGEHQHSGEHSHEMASSQN